MADNITRLPNKSPARSTTMVSKGRTNIIPEPKAGQLYRLPTQTSPANKNVPRVTRENAIRAKNPQTNKINSGKFAYGPKPSAGPSMGSRIAGTVARGALRAAGPVGALIGMTGSAGTVARGALRAAGPVGALVSMTSPAGAPKGHPAYESSTIRKTGSYGPLMKGNSKPSGKISVPGGRGITAFGGSSKPPKSTGGKMAVPGGRGVTAITFGGSSKDQSRVPASRSGGFMGPSKSSGGMRSGPGATGGSKTASKTTSKSSGGMRSGPGATGGSKTAGRSTSSKSNLGTSRF